MEAAEAWGKKHYGDWSKRFRECEPKDALGHPCSALRGHLGDRHRAINDHLRNDGNGTIPYENSGTKDEIEELIATINEAPRVPENIIVYRVVAQSNTEEIIEASKSSHEMDKGFHEKGFLSTSLISEPAPDIKADNSRNCLLRIYTPKNALGAYVYLATYDRREEQEVLFLPNSYLRIINPKWWHCPFRREKIGKYQVYDCELSYRK
jgi:hypothetical protein